MCGATTGGLSLDGVDVKKESVIQGVVSRDVPISLAVSASKVSGASQRTSAGSGALPRRDCDHLATLSTCSRSAAAR